MNTAFKNSDRYAIIDTLFFLADESILHYESKNSESVLVQKIIAEGKKYLSLYTIEDYLFKIVGPRIRSRGFMKFDEFYQICIWKSARQKQNYRKNENIIEICSKEAFAEKDEILRIEKMCTLTGVGVPTASAILTIVYPDQYGVIDVRCIAMLNELGISIHASIDARRWIEYLEIIRRLAQKTHLTPRQIDQILFAMHRELLDKDFQNLYRKY